MRKIWNRLRHDTQLAIITGACLLGLVGIPPFALYRWLQGDLIIVAVDVVLILVTALALGLSWSWNKAELAGRVLAVLYGLGVVVIAINIPGSGLFWFYCFILFSFFIVPPVLSTVITLAVLVALCGYDVLLQPGSIFISLQQLVTFVCTGLICSLFAYIVAWRTTQQRRRLEQLANLDPLTGIGNRRTLMHEMEIALASFTRHSTQSGLLLMDIDHFKKINDSYGHMEGDRVLVELADLVWKSSRRTDRLFRLGGEEFVLLLPNISQSGLEIAANNILSTVATRLRSQGEPVTVSIGGTLLEPGDDSISWMHRADVCMYQAKNAGRNRILIHDPDAHRRFRAL